MTSALGLCVALAVAATPAHRAVAQERSLRPQPPALVRDLAPGKLLVAARELPDPNFAQTVVLLIDYDEERAMGLIVNRQTDVPLSRVFGERTRASQGSAPVYFGGPVQVEGALALVRSRAAREGARRVLDDVHLVNTRALLDELLSSGSASDRFRVYLGYSGWGKGQLQTETSRGAWHVLAGDARVVFDPEPDSVWPRQIQRADQRMALLDRFDRAAGPARGGWLRSTR